MISRIQSFSRYIKPVVFCIILLTSLVTSANAQNGQGIQLISTRFDEPNSNQFRSGGSSPSVSPDGNFVAFVSQGDILIRDKNAQTPQAVTTAFDSRNINDVNGISGSPSVSNGGNRVVFQSTSTNLVDPNIFISGNTTNIFVNEGGTIRAVSAPVDRSQAPNGFSFSPQITPDGSFVVFASTATNLTNDTNGLTPSVSRIYMANLQLDPPLITLMSPVNGFGNCLSPQISSDTSRIVFESNFQIFQLITGNTTPVVISRSDTEPAQLPVISGNGNVVAYLSQRGNGSVIVMDIGAAQITQIPDGGVLNSSISDEFLRPSLNADGSICAFISAVDFSSNSTPVPTFGFPVAYVFRRVDNVFEAISVADNSVDFPGTTAGISPSIDSSGLFAVFVTGSTLTQDDNDSLSTSNVYLRDRNFQIGAGTGGNGGNGGGVIAGGVNLIPNCPVRAIAVNSRQVDITWGAGQHNQFLEGHTLELFRQDADGKMIKLTTVSADNVTLYSDTTVQPKSKYMYRAWVVNPKGVGTAVDVFVKTKKEKK